MQPASLHPGGDKWVPANLKELSYGNLEIVVN